MDRTILQFDTGNYSIEEAGENGFFLTAAAAAVSEGRLPAIRIEGMKRWISLSRISPYWMEPFFGTDMGAIPNETQFLLWERTDGMYGIMLPLIDGTIRAVIAGTEQAVALILDGMAPFEETREALAAFTAIDSSPYPLISSSMKKIADKLRTFRIREEKNVPGFVDYLGWCTWDAFYQDVDEQKVLQGLQSFQEGGVQPGFVILDDGWLNTREAALQSFEPDHEKFPSGLKQLIQQAKDNYHVKIFGVWHAFAGYWLGVHPESPLAGEYHVIKKRGRPLNWVDHDENIGFIDPKDIHRFYHDFYGFLSGEGVDMVKVDAQSSLEAHTKGTHGRVSSMKRYQEALQGSAQMNFSGNLIHCMSNGSDVAYHMKSSMVWRNSNDFFPDRPAQDQQKHIYVNAMNNLWTSAFSLPDWDMFQSHHPQGEFHAAARSISGGPVYLCDKPYMQRFELINQLCISGGRALRCDAPALPTLDCVFVDCRKQEKLLKLMNRCGDIGVLGIFHCSQEADAITDTYSPSEVLSLEGELFAVFCHTSKKLALMKRDEVKEITLDRLGYEIITVSPVTHGFAAIGLLDKFNSSAVFNGVEEIGDKRFTASLKDGGASIGFYCGTAPRKVWIGKVEAEFNYDAQSRLLLLSASLGEEIRIEVQL